MVVDATNVAWYVVLYCDGLVFVGKVLCSIFCFLFFELMVGGRMR